jgi:hypothetical protein
MSTHVYNRENSVIMLKKAIKLLIKIVYLFVRASILPFSTIVQLDCGGNVQTRWYVFVRVSISTLSTIFLLNCFPPQSNRKIVEKSKIDTLTNKYHPVWTFPPQSNRKIVQRVKIYQFWPFLRFFYWIMVEMFRQGGICLLGYQFWPFVRFFYWIVVEIFRRVVFTNKYHPVWTFPP